MQDVSYKQFIKFINTGSSSYKEELKIGPNVLISHFNERDELIATDECIDNQLHYKVRQDYLK